MHRLRNYVVFLCSFVLALAVGASLAANTSSSKDLSAKPASKMSSKRTAIAQKTAVQSAKNASARTTNHVLASAEELSGTIGFVGPLHKEVTLIGANGVPYDFQLSRTTKVDLAGKRIKATELAEETHKQATIHFLPTARGNLAKSVEVNAS